ncbi:hypothetical protein LguiB_032781 [Lonicera macranthoides]
MADSSNSKLHVVMFPWLAFGHIIPFLELSKLIAQKGHKISFISTPNNINRLPKIPSNLKPNIDFIKIPLPRVENLPENAESTSDLPYKKVKYLKIAYDCLKEPVTLFLKSTSPDWVIFDFVSYWLGPIAKELEIRSAFFSIFMASGLAFAGPPEMQVAGEDYRVRLEDFTVAPKWVPFKTEVRMRHYQARRMFEDIAGDGGGNVSATYRFAATVNGCDAVAIRSCEEFEPEWLKLLEDFYQKPVIPVGLLPSTAADDDCDRRWVEIKAWLDKKAKGSVVYIAFGSETKPNQTELTELALGLEKSELPFFWVHKNQLGSSDIESTVLPEGFEERTRDRGVVHTTWAPQLKILSHDSVGSLLSHSGYSSGIEAVQFGKALIVMPFLGDQGMIATFLEEKNMAYSIPRDELDGSFTSDSVAESVRLVMLEEEGRVYRDKVNEMKGVLGDSNKQDHYVNNLLSYLEGDRRVKS